MKLFVPATLAILVAGVALAGPAHAVPAPVKYNSCNALHKVYPTGVAQSRAAARVAVAGGAARPVVAFRVYELSHTLDVDKDLVVCEVKAPPVASAPQSPAPQTPAPQTAASGVTYQPTGIGVFDALNQARVEKGEITQVQSNALTRIGGAVTSPTQNTAAKACPMWPYAVFRTGYLDNAVTPQVLAALGLTDADAAWTKSALSDAVLTYCVQIGVIPAPF